MREVRCVILIDREPKRVLAAFHDLELMRAWWKVDDALVDLKPGGVWSAAWERSDAGFKYVSVGRVAEYRENERLLLDAMLYFNPDRPILGPMTMDIRVSEADSSTRLEVLQSGYQDGPDWDWYYEAVRTAWPEALKMVKSCLEGESR